MPQNLSSGIKPALSGGTVRNFELMRSTFHCAMFSCALDGQRLNLLPNTSDLPSASLIVNSWVTLFGALPVSCAPALFTSCVISFAATSSL
eukprot:765135-Ditylum_brightwellii.AAC.1